VVWIGNVNECTTSANAITAATDIGAIYGLTSLSGMTYVDKAKTSGANVGACRVIGFSDQDDVGAFYGKVLFQVLESKCQLRMGNTSGFWENPGCIG
jgi:hypothetical protein